MGSSGPKPRCPLCRGHVRVEERDAHGDQINCDNCGAGIKVVRRNELVRVVVADVGPLRDELRQEQRRISNLESELARARASIGIGPTTGLGLGVLYVVARFALEEAPLDAVLFRNATIIAVVVGVALELANYLFLAKRHEMTRLSGEIGEAKKQARKTQQVIREAMRT